MEDKPFNFWSDHSRNFLEAAFRADRHESLENPDGYGKNTGECGDTVEMFLVLDGNSIKRVSFRVQGCMNTNACANATAELTEGKTVDEAWDVTPQDVVDFLETLPPENFHCAELVVGALYRALSRVKMEGTSMSRPQVDAFRKASE